MKYHAPVPAAGVAPAVGVAAAVGVADAAGAALAAAAVDFTVCTVPEADSTVPEVPELVELVGVAPEPAESVEADVAALSVAVVPSPGAVVDTAGFVELATALEGEVVDVDVLEVVVVPEADALAADEERGAADEGLLETRLRADPADARAGFGFEDVPVPLAELGFDAESDEPPSVAADATP